MSNSDIKLLNIIDGLLSDISFLLRVKVRTVNACLSDFLLNESTNFANSKLSEEIKENEFFEKNIRFLDELDSLSDDYVQKVENLTAKIFKK